MTLNSMTGYARLEGEITPASDTGSDGTAAGATPWRWSWEIRSVNAKGLDIRMRLPNGRDHLEAPVRKAIGEVLARGSVSVSLSISRESVASRMVVNEPLLEQILDLQNTLEGRGVVYPAPPRLDALLGVRGLFEMEAAEPSTEDSAAAEEAAMAGLKGLLDELVGMRHGEGQAMGRVLVEHLETLDQLRQAAKARADAQPMALRTKIEEQLATLLEASPPVSEDRLAQELALLATKADVREELDRLGAHIDSCRDLLGGGGPVGRKLDFLCQELNRESNTICSKSADMELTRIGLDLKSTVERFREQVQNVE